VGGAPTMAASVHLLALLLLVSHGDQPSLLRVTPDRVPDGPFGITEPGRAPIPKKNAHPLHILWQRPLPPESVHAWRQPERATPLIRQDDVIVGTSRASGLFVFERQTGALLKRIPTAGPVEAPIQQLDPSGDLIFGDTAGFVYRMTPSGTVRWKHESIGPVVDACTAGHGKVLYRAVDGSLVALDLETGETLWTYRRGPRYRPGLAIFGASVPVFTPNGAIVAGFSDGTVVALRQEDGALKWDRRISAGERWTDVDTQPVLLQDNRIVVAAYLGPTACIQADTGEELWRVDSVGAEGRPLVKNNTIYLSTTNGAVLALAAANGHRVWRFELPDGRIATSPTWWRRHLLVGDVRGQIHIIDPVTGEERWYSRFDTVITGFSGALAADESLVFGVSDGGWVYAFAPDDFIPTPTPSRRDDWQSLWAGPDQP